MRKVKYLLKEAYYLVMEHKLFFLAPLLTLFCFIAICFFYFGPSVVVSFIYAGV